MGQSTEELTSQIEDTRQKMAGDLDTLQDRVSPSAIVGRRKQAARDRLSSWKDNVMGSAQSAKESASDSAGGAVSTAQQQYAGSPLAAGLVAFGAGMVVASLLPASRAEAEAAHRVVEAAKEHGQPLVDEARAAGQQVADEVRQSATQAVQEVKDSAQESVQTVKDEGQSSADNVRGATSQGIS